MPSGPRLQGVKPGMIVTKDMAIERADFRRLLSRLAEDKTIEETDDGFRLGDVTFTLAPLPARTIASLSLARSMVTIDLQALDQTRAESFLAKFDQTFRRGGG